MMLKIFICLAVLLILFIILKFCYRNQEKFEEDVERAEKVVLWLAALIASAGVGLISLILIWW